MFEKIKEIIVEELGVDASEVTVDSNLTEDLGADSLDAVELIMSIEDAFEIEIPDTIAHAMKTVKDIVDYIENNK
ncbi:acyl carrier protein [Mycoplasmatota bacterium WC44]